MSTPADVAFCLVPPLPTSRVRSRSWAPTRTPSQNAYTPRNEHTASRSSSRSPADGTWPSACATPAVEAHPHRAGQRPQPGVVLEQAGDHVLEPPVAQGQVLGVRRGHARILPTLVPRPPADMPVSPRLGTFRAVSE